jgi:sugar lactone lactonase YvrE
MPEPLYTARAFTKPQGWTEGIEGPAVDRFGNLYAVNFARQHTIGKVAPDGVESVFVELPEGSTGNGIRFTRAGLMLIADYTGHNLLAVDMDTRKVAIYAEEGRMNQPNDLAITAGDVVFASDPNWKESTGNMWRVGVDRKVTLVESGMGTSNGIEVSPDERTLYVNESAQLNVWAYDLSDSALPSRKRLLIRFPDFGLDGMRADVDGSLYITRWGKGTIAKVSPDGRVLLEVALHGKRPTNIAFGGPDGCTAYVTVADSDCCNIETFRVEHPGREWMLAQRGTKE